MATQVTWCDPMKLDEEGSVPLDLVERAAKIVDLSGAVTQLEDWIAADRAGVNKHAGGRPPYVSIRAALILIVLVGMLGKPLYVTNAAEIVRFRLHGKAWQVVGLDMAEYKNRHATQWYDRIWHTIRHKVRKPLDPYPETAIYKRLTQEAYEAIKNSRDPDYVKARKLRGSIFSSLLAFASARQMGDKYFVDGTYEGDIVVDATPIETLTYGNREGDLRPSNADAGYYIRTGDHNGGDSPTVRKRLWGYDLTVVEATGGYFTGDMPKPIIGLSLDNPGVQPGYNARAALAVYENAVVSADNGEHLMLPRGLAIGDMAYSPGSDAQSYQIPMWLAGWSVMGQTPKRPEARGVSFSYEGIVLIDGKPYSPAITSFPDLLDPKSELDAKVISREVFDERIQRRKAFELSVHEVREDRSIRFACPALRGAVQCPKRKADIKARKAAAKKTLAGKTPLPLTVKNVPTTAAGEKICSQKTVLVDVSDETKTFWKYYTPGPATYSREWEEIYRPLRAMIESKNGVFKSEVAIGLGERTKRYMRGYAAFVLFVGVAAVVTNWVTAQKYLKRRRDEALRPPPRGGRPKKKRAEEDKLLNVAAANAPPKIGKAA